MGLLHKSGTGTEVQAASLTAALWAAVQVRMRVIYSARAASDSRSSFVRNSQHLQ